MIYTGATAKLKYGNQANKTEVAYISNFSFETKREYIEVAILGAKTKEVIPNFFSWTGSAEGAIGYEERATQLSLYDSMLNGKKVEFWFYIFEGIVEAEGGITKGQGYHGFGYIESMNMDTSAEDKTGISISVKGIGDLTLFGEVNGAIVELDNLGNPIL